MIDAKLQLWFIHCIQLLLPCIDFRFVQPIAAGHLSSKKERPSRALVKAVKTHLHLVYEGWITR